MHLHPLALLAWGNSRARSNNNINVRRIPKFPLGIGKSFFELAIARVSHYILRFALACWQSARPAAELRQPFNNSNRSDAACTSRETTTQRHMIVVVRILKPNWKINPLNCFVRSVHRTAPMCIAGNNMSVRATSFLLPCNDDWREVPSDTFQWNIYEHVTRHMHCIIRRDFRRKSVKTMNDESQNSFFYPCPTLPLPHCAVEMLSQLLFIVINCPEMNASSTKTIGRSLAMENVGIFSVFTKWIHKRIARPCVLSFPHETFSISSLPYAHRIRPNSNHHHQHHHHHNNKIEKIYFFQSKMKAT